MWRKHSCVKYQDILYTFLVPFGTTGCPWQGGQRLRDHIRSALWCFAGWVKGAQGFGAAERTLEPGREAHRIESIAKPLSLNGFARQSVKDVMRLNTLVLAASPLLGTHGGPRTSGRFHFKLCAAHSPFRQLVPAPLALANLCTHPPTGLSVLLTRHSGSPIAYLKVSRTTPKRREKI
jgi:hypothetical protein